MDYLNNFTDTLTTTVGSMVPGVLGALLVLLIGFSIAGIVRRLAKGLFSRTKIDERIGSSIGTAYRVDTFVSKLLYYVVVVYTLIIVLNMLGVSDALEPLQKMITEFVGFLPNIIAAGIIGFAGYMIGKLGSEATGFLSERLEGFGSRVGLKSSGIDISNIVKQVVFILIFIPILIVALDTLDMKAISEPATEMLGSFLNAIPQIIAAGLLLTVFYIAGKYIVSVLVELLGNLGLDNFSKQLGLQSVIGDTSVSKLIGNIVLFFIVFTGIIAAADKLELGQVETILHDIFDIAGKVFFGLIILMGGIFISNIASTTLSKSDNNKWLVPIVRFAILGIFLAFALHTMGIAESIVNLAFGLTLGAIAVAFALSFGLGGREAAGKQLEHFFSKMRNKQ